MAQPISYKVELRNLLRFPEMENLRHKIMPPEGHAEQELDAGHRLVPRADAHTALDQVPLESLHVVWRCRI